jgi:hypothetical protein
MPDKYFLPDKSMVQVFAAPIGAAAKIFWN